MKSFHIEDVNVANSILDVKNIKRAFQPEAEMNSLALSCHWGDITEGIEYQSKCHTYTRALYFY